MYAYTWYQWLFFFYLYCFFGWIFESAYVSIKERRLVNRGFLRLPMLPLYGSGAVMMLWVSIPFQDSLILTYISGVIGATALEYVTGYGMEQLFKVRYWDYSHEPLNVHGYICLGSSLAWGFLTIFMTHVIHKPIERAVLSLPVIPETLFVLAVSVLFVYDCIICTREALALGKSLESLRKLRGQLEAMEVQAALLKMEAAERLETKKEALRERRLEWYEDRLERFEERTGLRLEDLRDHAGRKLRIEELRGFKDLTGLHLEELRGKTEPQLLERLAETEERIAALRAHSTKRLRHVLRSNPSAASVRFERFLKEAREHLKEDL